MWSPDLLLLVPFGTLTKEGVAMRKKGFVIAFHNDETRNPYHGFTCVNVAIRTLKPHIPGEVAEKVSSFFGSENKEGKEEFDRVKSRISLEAGIARCDEEVLAFVKRKIEEGDNIFLDLKEEHSRRHNASELRERYFTIVPIFVTLTEFKLLNPEYFSVADIRDIVILVTKSQAGRLRYNQDLKEVDAPRSGGGVSV